MVIQQSSRAWPGGFTISKPLLRAALGVTKDTVFLDPHRSRQHEIRELGGGSRIDLGDDQELVIEILLARKELLQIRQRVPGIGDLHPDGADVAPRACRLAETLPHRDGMLARLSD